MDALICRAKPRHAEKTKSEQNAPQQPEKDSKTTKTYKLNEIVLYRKEFKNEVKWLKAKAILSKSRYKIELLKRGSRRDCHGGQLRIFNEKEIS